MHLNVYRLCLLILKITQIIHSDLQQITHYSFLEHIINCFLYSRNYVEYRKTLETFTKFKEYYYIIISYLPVHTEFVSLYLFHIFCMLNV